MSEAEVERLSRRHADIRLHGAGVIEREAAKIERRLQLQAFALKHRLRCFKCGTSLNEWAKTGITHGRPWAICIQCIRERRPPAKGAA